MEPEVLIKSLVKETDATVAGKPLEVAGEAMAAACLRLAEGMRNSDHPERERIRAQALESYSKLVKFLGLSDDDVLEHERRSFAPRGPT
jgi:hypothetical protein